MEDFDSDDDEENFPLHSLVVKKCCSIANVKYILNSGVPINSYNFYGETPLHLSVSSSNCPLEVIKYLLDSGADVNALDDTSKIPLHYIGKCRFKKALDIANLLLDHGADINAEDNEGRSVLHLVLLQSFGCKVLIELLLDRGANINALDHNEDSPLYYCIRYMCSIYIMDLFLQRGANVSHRNAEGECLHWAVPCRTLKVIQLLINYGAQVNIIDCNGKSPLFFAVNINKIETISMLLTNGALVSCGESPLNDIIHKYSKNEVTLKTVQLLLKYALLENAELHIEEFPVELTDYREGCLRDIRAMQQVSIDGSTLQQYILNLLKELKHKSKNEIYLVSDKLLYLILTNAYPLYNDVIFILLKMEYLVYKLYSHLMYTVANEPDPFSGMHEFQVLHRHVQPILLRYLSKKDVLNLLGVYYKICGCFKSTKIG